MLKWMWTHDGGLAKMESTRIDLEVAEVVTVVLAVLRRSEENVTLGVESTTDWEAVCLGLVEEYAGSSLRRGSQEHRTSNQ